MYLLLTLAWRNLWMHKLRTMLTIISIMLGVAVVLAVRTANRSTFRSVEALFIEAAGKSSLTVENATPSHRSQIGFRRDIVQQVQAMPGVVQAVPRLTAWTVYQGKKGSIELAMQGVDPAVDDQVRIYSLVEGDFLSPDSRSYAVVVVDEFARREDIHVGRDIQLLTPGGLETFRVVGILARKNAGVMNGGRVAFVSLQVAQRVFERGREIDAVDVVVEPAIARSVTSLDQFRGQMQAALGESYEVMYPAAKGRTVTEALSSFQYSLEIFGWFALFTSALLIYTTFTMEIAERVREVGMLRLLGTSRMQIAVELLNGALLPSLIGSGLGLGLGFVLAVPLLRLYGSWAGYELVSLSPSAADVVRSLCLGLMVTIISVLWPMIQACRLSPLEAVRLRGQEPEGKFIRYSWIIGLVLLALWGASYPIVPQLSNTPFFLTSFVGITLVLPSVVYLIGKWARRPMAAVYGYEGSLGSTNMERSRWRTSTTVAVLVVSITMGVSVGAVSESLMTSIMSWIDNTLNADLFVTSYAPMNPIWGRRLATMEDVAVVSPTRIVEVQAQDPRNPGHRFTAVVQAVDPATRGQVGEMIYVSGQGDPDDLWATFAQGRSLLVSTQYAQQYDIHKGDILRLRTARGIQEFLVTAVILHHGSGEGLMMVTWDDMRRFFRVNDIDMYLLKVNPGADLDSVRQQIETGYGHGGRLTVESNADLRQSMRQLVNRVVTTFNSVVLIAFIVAAFSIINTLTMSVIERTREIGLLRAVGMTRLQIGKMILAEAVVMGLTSILCGVTFGMVFARLTVWWMNYNFGWHVSYAWPTVALLISCVLALVVSQLAALLPARRASGLTVIEALRYE